MKKVFKTISMVALLGLIVALVPTFALAQDPTAEPTMEATMEPTMEATMEPTVEPTAEP